MVSRPVRFLRALGRRALPTLWRRGQRRPARKILSAIAAAVGIPIEDLVADRDVEPRR